MKKNLTLVFLIAVFYFQNVSATTYYWVPYGSGIWGKNTHVVADSSNWSTISGGKGNQGYPTSTDTAYFDANSFTIGHDSVLVSGNIAVHSIIFNTLGQKATFGNQTNADTVKLYGSFLLDTNVIFRANACGYVFYSYGSTVNQIDMKKNAFTSYYNNYAFNGNGAGWKLLSNLDMSASNIVFGTGAKFNTNGFDVYTINTTNADSVQITIKGPTLWTAQTLDFTGKGSTLAMDSNARFHIWFNTANGKMRAAGYPYCTFNGGGLKFSNVWFDGSAYINQSNTFDTLKVYANDSLVIQNGTTQSYNHLVSLSNYASIGAIASADTNRLDTANGVGYVNMVNLTNEKTCLYYMNLRNVKFKGGKTLIYGANSYVNVLGDTTANILSNVIGKYIKAPTCKGGNDGVAIATPYGGLSPYIYSWNHYTQQSTMFNVVDSNRSGADTLRTIAAGGGSYNVTVSDKCGQVYSNSSSMINAPDTGSTNFIATPVLSNDTILCGGQKVNLKAITTSSPISFAWAPSIGLNVTNIDSVIAGPLTTTTYTVTLTQGTCVKKYPIKVEIDNPKARLATHKIDVCLGQAILIDGSASTGLVDSANWSTNPPQLQRGLTVLTNKMNSVAGAPINPISTGGQSFLFTNSRIQKAQATSIGSETVYLTLNGGYYNANIGTYSCVSKDSLQLNVFDTMHLVSYSHDSLYCHPQKMLPMQVSFSSNSAINYSWSPNKNLDSSNTSTVHVIQLSHDTTYTVKASNAGCSTSKSIKLYVRTPVAKLLQDTGINLFCPGPSLPLNASSSKGTLLWNTAPFEGYTQISPTEISVTSKYPGKYTFFLTASDSTCSAKDSVQFQVLDSVSHISGRVTLNAGTIQVAKGKLVLFKDNGKNKGIWPIVDTLSLDAQGNFSFDSTKISAGRYIVGVFPDRIMYPLATSMYYLKSTTKQDTAAFKWDSASVINISCDAHLNLQIGMHSLPDLTIGAGTGTINGRIYEGPGYTGAKILKMTHYNQGASQPIGGVSVLLGKRPTPAADIIATTHTDTAGFYQFKDVPDGEYTIFADIPGLPMDSSYHVTVNTTKGVDSIPNNNYFVNDTVIYIVKDPLGIKEQKLPVATYNPLTVYPNPSHGQVNIEVAVTMPNSDISLVIYDILGEQVMHIANAKLNEGTHLYNLNTAEIGCTPGIYFIKLTVNNTTYSRRLVEIGK